ncbi:OmpA family protein [Hyphomicrobium sp. NDB2Meth4]|uniref:OmpA family protein n=1 Tax=Hyphomicrobium sp. NDB2Meth4 TaxID=1892846 RepID=UPI0009F84247|nr:OmpA family protein [Hyphomicrobium sp. NDB2Meth4]
MRRLLIVPTLSIAVPALLCAAAQAASPIPGAYEVAQAPIRLQGTPPDDEKSQDKKQGDDKGRREGGRQGGGKPQQDGQGAQQRRDGGGEREQRRDNAQQRKPQQNPQAQQQQQKKPQDNPQAQQPSRQNPNQAQDNRKDDRRNNNAGPGAPGAPQGQRDGRPNDRDRNQRPGRGDQAGQGGPKGPPPHGLPGSPTGKGPGPRDNAGPPPRSGNEPPRQDAQRNDNAGPGAPGGPQGPRDGRPNDRDRDQRPGRDDQAGQGGPKGPPPQGLPGSPTGKGPGPRDNAGPPPRSGNEPPRQDARRDDKRPGGRGSIDEIKRGRRERVEDGGRRTIIEEPGNRTIVQQKGRPPMIRHDEGDRMRRTSRDVRRERRPDGGSLAIAIRPGGIEVYSEFDDTGRLMRRYRRDRDGREWDLIDNRRFRGAPIFLDLGPPRLRMPRDRYILDYDRASDEDLYDALMDGPVDELDRAYSLDEIRYNAYLRDRMRRVDLDTVTFDFGAWQVPYDQYGRLERIARTINRILDRRPNEVFLIEGHTDAVGSDLDNLTLSDRRAEEVAVILTETFGVPPENLVTQGYGEEFLKVPTSGPERANRRVSVRRITPLMARRR